MPFHRAGLSTMLFCGGSIDSSGQGETIMRHTYRVACWGKNRYDVILCWGIFSYLCLHKPSPYSPVRFHSNPLPVQNHAKTSCHHTPIPSNPIEPPSFYPNQHNGAPPDLRSHQNRFLYIDTKEPYHFQHFFVINIIFIHLVEVALSPQAYS